MKVPATAITLATDFATATRDEQFAALVERQSRFVFRVAYALLRSSADSEDVVQDTFLKLYKSGAWKRMDDERAFLARTAWRIAQNRRRRRGEKEPLPELSDDRPGVETVMTEAGRIATVHRLIDALPEELRQPLLLSAIEELNSRAIAAVLNIPEGTVRSRLMRARDLLKTRLATLERRTAK